jgi:hypothetical protein
MSRRIALSVAAGVVVLGGAGALTLAYAGDQPLALAHSTARYTAPDGDRDGSFTFAENELTAKDMADVDSAVCKPSGKDTVHCTYDVKVTGSDAESSPRGAWHVAVLATAQDGTTTLDTEAADFTVR